VRQRRRTRHLGGPYEPGGDVEIAFIVDMETLAMDEPAPGALDYPPAWEYLEGVGIGTGDEFGFDLVAAERGEGALEPGVVPELGQPPGLGDGQLDGLGAGGVVGGVGGDDRDGEQQPERVDDPEGLATRARQSAVHQNYYRRLGIPSGPYRRASPGQARCFERMVKPGLARLDAE
jgi:hypothetical protein